MWSLNQFKKRLPLLLGVSSLVILLDQWSKAWIHQHLSRFESITVVSRFFHIVHVHNQGAAFGILATWKGGTIFLTLVSISAITCILAMILGGAIGNLTDRLRFGYVIDFIDWHLDDVYHWPAFNVADSAISVAVALLLLDLLMETMHGKTKVRGGV